MSHRHRDRCRREREFRPREHREFGREMGEPMFIAVPIPQTYGGIPAHGMGMMAPGWPVCPSRPMDGMDGMDGMCPRC